ncbi:alpha/beta hydrolase [Sphingomonas daechungensis]|uniref:alpha/beta hydrolase n=1 Tax=Sphingomonas daechungensis TaxID=1176646 RepID=UPI0037844E68
MTLKLRLPRKLVDTIASLVSRTTPSLSGLIAGSLFVALSLTPSLLPRTWVAQGVLSGVSFAVGYFLGLFADWLWRALHLPRRSVMDLPNGRAVVAVVCLLLILPFAWRAAAWQNSTRVLMDLEPVRTIHPAGVLVVASITMLVIVAFVRLAKMTIRALSRSAARVMPERTATILGMLGAFLLFWVVATGIVIRFGMQVVDSSYRTYDAFVEPDLSPPSDPLKSGSAASLLNWQELGRQGRRYISSGPSAAEIGAVLGQPAREPLRVYVGMRSAATPEQRAMLALRELERTGGFDRAALVVITPTGTGWVDEAGIDPIEFLEGGDIASVAMQYSYLSSPLSLIAEPDNGNESARALFNAIYRHWTSLPEDKRPRLYLYGLSLGALNSSRAADPFELAGEPIQGALWAGPPFASRIWRSITDGRNPGSPEWLPQFRDGRAVRFMNQQSGHGQRSKAWGRIRIVYLQYASDPVTFFEFSSIYRRPDWTRGRLGPDVSPELRWFPIVSFLQLAGDMATFTNTPTGFGHSFAVDHYIDAWMEVADVQGWPPERVERLKRHLQKLPAEPSEI